MGGHTKINTTKINSNKMEHQDPRISKSDALIWDAFLELAEETKDQFPFGAVTLMRRCGKPYSAATITRERGGLTHWYNEKRSAFSSDLNELLESEHALDGEISSSFCRKVGFLIVSYYELFSHDIITERYSNTKMIVKAVSPLIMEKSIIFFGAEIYALIEEWYQNDDFTRESVLAGYESKLRQIFIKYQKPRLRV